MHLTTSHQTPRISFHYFQLIGLNTESVWSRMLCSVLPFFFSSHSFPGSGVVTCTQGFNEHMNNSYPFLLLLGVSSLLLFHSEGDATLIIALQCFECLKIACIMATSLICGIVL